jgi:hypothetical protein
VSKEGRKGEAGLLAATFGKFSKYSGKRVGPISGSGAQDKAK